MYCRIFCSQHFLTLAGLEVSSILTYTITDKMNIELHLFQGDFYKSVWPVVLKQNKMVYISEFLVAVIKSGNENSHCYACYFLAFRD
jgi:hypothetical protein